MDKRDAHNVTMSIPELLDWHCQGDTLPRLIAELGIAKLAREIDAKAREQAIEYGPFYDLISALEWTRVDEIHQREIR